jgi:hypothetical protein
LPIQAIEELQHVRQQLQLPTYVLHATADKLTQYEVGSQQLQLSHICY